MGVERRVKINRDGGNEAVTIPAEFDFTGDEGILRRDGERLILEPAPKKKSLLALLARLKPLDEEFPDVDEGLLPPRDIEL